MYTGGVIDIIVNVIGSELYWDISCVEIFIAQTII